MFKFAISCLLAACTLLPDATHAAATATDLAPPETIFFSTATNVPKFYKDFLQYHNASLASPIMAAAIQSQNADALLKVGPGGYSCPLALEATELLYTLVETQLFCAVLAGPDGALTFLGGGLSPDVEASLTKIKAAINARVPGTWEGNKIGTAPAEFLEIPGVGRFYVCSTGSWVLLGTNLRGLEHAVSAVTRPGHGLSSTDLWKTNTRVQPSDRALLYFSRLDVLPKLSTAAGRNQLVALVSQRLGGLRAYSWTFSTSGPGSIATDIFSYTLEEPTGESLRAMTAPLSSEWRTQVGPNATGFLAVQVNLPQLAAAPAFAGLRFAGIAGMFTTPTAKSPSPPQVGWTASWDAEACRSASAWFFKGLGVQDDPALKALFDDGAGKNHGVAAKGNLVWWGQTDAVRHFLKQEPDSSPQILEITDALPAAENAFVDFRLDRQATALNAAQELTKNYPQWAEALRKNGIALPATAPSFDLDDSLGPLRTTIGMSESNLVVVNGFQLGKKTGSTLLTATSEIMQIAYREQIAAFTDAARFLFSRQTMEDSGAFSQTALRLITPDPTKPLPADAPNLFDIFLWTNFLGGPLFAPHQNSVFSDIVSQIYLADPPEP